MKKTILLSYLALLICFLLPLGSRDKPVQAPLETESPVESSAPEKAKETEITAAPAPETVKILCGDSIEEKDMQEYLVGVVAAEMPASFPPEALKAQSVAARTYAMYCAAGNKHGEAHLCTDSNCCQAWQSHEQLREKWGGEYENYVEKIKTAVETTAGEYLSYQGEPIFAAFHSSSAGKTQDSGSVWNQLPYLLSVSSPENEENVPNYLSVVECAPIDLRDTILSAFPEADFTGSEDSWIGEIIRDESGRVEYAVMGGAEIEGTKLRSLFSLRSTAFELDYADGIFRFSVKGYGHGVGMSQYGAKLMAEEGSDYAEILAHYYQGTYLIRS